MSGKSVSSYGNKDRNVLRNVVVELRIVLALALLGSYVRKSIESQLGRIALKTGWKNPGRISNTYVCPCEYAPRWLKISCQ